MRLYVLLTRDPNGEVDVANSVTQDGMNIAPDQWASMVRFTRERVEEQRARGRDGWALGLPISFAVAVMELPQATLDQLTV